MNVYFNKKFENVPFLQILQIFTKVVVYKIKKKLK